MWCDRTIKKRQVEGGWTKFEKKGVPKIARSSYNSGRRNPSILFQTNAGIAGRSHMTNLDV